MYKLLIRRILFWFDPEKVHYFTFSLIRNLSLIPGFSQLFKFLYLVEDKRLQTEVFGLKFPNPVGLAAGFDKDAKLFNELADFGFGFIEIGTLTPVGQVGNPKKRLFRLKKDSAIPAADSYVRFAKPRTFCKSNSLKLGRRWKFRPIGVADLLQI